jgi:hypothetical protein
VSKLEGKGWKDQTEVSAVLGIARAEKRGSKPSVSEDAFRNRLCDRGLASPGESIQPVDRRRGVIFGPQFYVVQDGFAGPFEAAGASSMSELGSFSSSAAVERRQLSYSPVSPSQLRVGLNLTCVLYGLINI